ncbi:hypothetical protein CI105_04380 [Candidatus Izimaplasma bacterium ZiA1]|uniref:hypothetical protein n=1 Tax=Candidatus Izimoplasma sp. ZiA1 TaxID=2024899 RepID=UPI000BAA6F71|nr:hypothetical protein CI105_04380 [Candidatus Izimaplasma bacterium ZiA1]
MVFSKVLSTYLYFCFSKKTYYISLGMIVINSLLFIYFSSFTTNIHELLINQSNYYNEYISECISFLKLELIVLIVFMIIDCFNKNNYDYFLLNKTYRSRVIISKITAIYIVIILILLVNYLLFLLIPLVLTPYFYVNNVLVILFIRLLIFCLYYLLLGIIFYLVFKSIYGLLMFFTLYMVTYTINGFLENINDVKGFKVVYSIFFPELFYSINNQYIFLFKEYIILSLIFLLSTITLSMYNSTDI